MTVTFKRYTNTGEIFGRFNIEFRLSPSELIDIVGKFFSERLDGDPKPSKRAVEKFIRDELRFSGTGFWTWHDGLEGAEYLEDLEQARDILCKFWPALADHFHNVEL